MILSQPYNLLNLVTIFVKWAQWWLCCLLLRVAIKWGCVCESTVIVMICKRLRYFYYSLPSALMLENTGREGNLWLSELFLCGARGRRLWQRMIELGIWGAGFEYCLSCCNTVSPQAASLTSLLSISAKWDGYSRLSLRFLSSTKFCMSLIKEIS